MRAGIFLLGSRPRPHILGWGCAEWRCRLSRSIPNECCGGWAFLQQQYSFLGPKMRWVVLEGSREAKVDDGNWWAKGRRGMRAPKAKATVSTVNRTRPSPAVAVAMAPATDKWGERGWGGWSENGGCTHILGKNGNNGRGRGQGQIGNLAIENRGEWDAAWA